MPYLVEIICGASRILVFAKLFRWRPHTFSGIFCLFPWREPSKRMCVCGVCDELFHGHSSKKYALLKTFFPLVWVVDASSLLSLGFVFNYVFGNSYVWYNSHFWFAKPTFFKAHLPRFSHSSVDKLHCLFFLPARNQGQRMAYDRLFQKDFKVGPSPTPPFPRLLSFLGIFGGHKMPFNSPYISLAL